MTFTGLPLSAVLLLAAGTAGLLAALHLLKIRPREVRVPTILFWKHAAESRSASTLLERFRHPLTYAFLTAISMLLALILGGPVFTGTSGEVRHTLFIVDGGPTMGIREEGADRRPFAEALEAAFSEAARLPHGDHAALILADPWPRVVKGFDAPRPWLGKPGFNKPTVVVPVAKRAAVEVARALLRDRAGARIRIFTDHPREWLLRGGDGAIPMEAFRVGPRAPNAAILSAQFEPDRDDPGRGRFLLRAGFYGGAPRRVELELRDPSGREIFNQAALMEPGATHVFAAPDLPLEITELEARLKPPDVFPADDTARITVPSRRPVRLSIRAVLPDALRTALASAPGFEVIDRLEDAEVVFLPQDAPDPGIPFIRVGGSLPAAPAGAPVERALSDPWLRDLVFRDTWCGKGASLGALQDGMKPLLRAGEAVLAARTGEEGSPALLLAPALLAADSNVWQQAAFTVFLARAVRDLAGRKPAPVVLGPDRLAWDPLWPERTGEEAVLLTLPGHRSASDLWTRLDRAPPLKREQDGFETPFDLFDLLLVLAAVLFLMEAILFTRGRIT